MDEAELKRIREKIEKELTGDAEHDSVVLDRWGRFYRDVPGAEPLLLEIGRRLFYLTVPNDEEKEALQQIFNNIVRSAGDEFAEACSLIEQRQYDTALEKLSVLTALIKAYPLSEDAVWMDFNSFLDGLVYQDFFEEEIGGREVKRHPMHPGEILFTYGNLLIELDRAEEALEPLQMILSFDPVCPKYLFELGDALKRTGRIRDAYSTALWALNCASDRKELARCYRDLAFCMTESGAFDDAVMLYLLSQCFDRSDQANAELIWIRKKTGTSIGMYNEEKTLRRCEELNIPVGLNETVQSNISFLNMLQAGEDPKAE